MDGKQIKNNSIPSAALVSGVEDSVSGATYSDNTLYLYKPSETLSVVISGGSSVDAYTKIQSDANFLSSTTSYYTELQTNSNFLSANTSYYTQTQANGSFLSANTSYDNYQYFTVTADDSNTNQVDSTGSLNILGVSGLTTESDGRDNFIIHFTTETKSMIDNTYSGITLSETFTGNSEITPSNDIQLVIIQELEGDIIINNRSGTNVNGQKLIFRIFDSESHNITWNVVYVVIGTTLPTATTINKYHYISCIYNEESSSWDVIDVKEEV